MAPVTRTSSGTSTRMSRWRPTPEQLMVLQELFTRRGVKTPTAQQIQRITQQLEQFGKVETKNVFYWFQNHKAREKQKLKKRLLNCCYYYYFQQQQHQHHRHRVEVCGNATTDHPEQPNVLYYCPPQSQPHSLGFWRPFIPATGSAQTLVPEIAAAVASSENLSGYSTDHQNLCNGVNEAAADHHQPQGDNDDDGRISPEGEWRVIKLMNNDVIKLPPKTLQLFPTTTIKNPNGQDAAATTADLCNSPSLSLSLSS